MHNQSQIIGSYARHSHAIATMLDNLSSGAFIIAPTYHRSKWLVVIPVFSK